MDSRQLFCQSLKKDEEQFAWIKILIYKIVFVIEHGNFRGKWYEN